MKIFPIIPGLLYQSAKTHQLNTQAKKDLISMYRLSVVVNLWHTIDEELSQMTKLYIHQYNPDGKTPIHEPLAKLADELFVHIKAGKAILVHCWGGKNRSGLLNAMLVMRYRGCDGEMALNHIRACRPGSFSNKHFEQWLLEQGVFHANSAEEKEGTG